MVRNVILALLAFVANYGQATADRDSFSVGQSFRSPDGRFIAQLESGDFSNLKIKDNQTGEVASETVDLPTLLSLKWTGNSKAIVIVEHIAGGSVASVIALNQCWARQDLFPPRNGDTCEVVKEKVGWDTVNLSYTASQRAGTAFLFWTSCFEVNANTGAVTHVTTENISADAYQALK